MSDRYSTMIIGRPRFLECLRYDGLTTKDGQPAVGVSSWLETQDQFAQTVFTATEVDRVIAREVTRLTGLVQRAVADDLANIPGLLSGMKTPSRDLAFFREMKARLDGSFVPPPIPD